jgi:competence protein ComEC
LAAGIFAAHFNYFQLHELVWPVALVFLLLSAVCLVPGARRMWLAAVLLAFSLVGIATQIVHRQIKTPKLNVDDGETVLLDGCVVDPPVFAPGKAQFTLQLAPHAAVRISEQLKDGPIPQFGYGERVEAAAKVRTPHNFENPGEFDYAGWLAAQHIYWTGTVSSASDLRVLPGSCGSRSLAWLYNVRTWALNRLDGLYPGDPQTALLLKAILLGQTAGVERRWTTDFRLTGTYHALVISGQHIAVLAVTLLFLLRLLHLGRIPSLSLATLACWVYAFISGLSAPVVRAAGGFTLFLAANFLFRRVRIINALAVVGLLYLAFDPDELFDPSFQLSFLSAAALALFALPLMERWTEPLRVAARTANRAVADSKKDPRVAGLRVELRLIAEALALWLRLPEAKALALTGIIARLVAYTAEAMLISACVQLGLVLPMVDYFHRFSVTGVAANVIVVPLLSVVVPVGFAAIFSGWHWLGAITSWFLFVAERIAAWHARFEPSWRISNPPLWVELAFCLALVLLALSLRHGRIVLPLAGGIAVGLLGLICWQPWRPSLRPGWLEVSSIDVGQGDSLFIAFPNGETMLVDAGGFPGMSRMARKPNLDIGEDVVAPYLWSRGIHHLDYAVLTHGHSDHMAGFPAVLDSFHPRELWIGPEPRTEEWTAVEGTARRDGVRIRSLRSDAPEMHFGAARVRILAPHLDYSAGDSANNNDSLVLLMQFGSRRVLLTGDAEHPIEDELLAAQQLQPVTLLKVGHHGSRTSSSEELLNATRPQFAFISAGYLNQFHHPHKDVLSRLAEHHAMVLRTDRNGLLTFMTDGEHVEVTDYRQ